MPDRAAPNAPDAPGASAFSEAPAAPGALVCGACPRGCTLAPRQTGACHARGRVADSSIVALNYGLVTGLALDPIEKKPLHFFRPGSRILSVGSLGCNLHCAFCQNSNISQAGPDSAIARRAERLSPTELADYAASPALVARGNIGVAYTYNEPLVGWEFVRDTAVHVHERGQSNVVVTNGCFATTVVTQLTPLIDAYNIDLKCFDADAYARLGGDLDTVRAFITAAVEAGAHVEITTLVVPGISDDTADMAREAAWIASLSPSIPLHLTRFFPRYRMRDAQPTSLALLRELAAVASGHLEHVIIGNV